MTITLAGKLISIAMLLAAFSLLAMGCAGMQAGKGTYTSDQDALAVQQMEWNLDPYR